MYLVDHGVNSQWKIISMISWCVFVWQKCIPRYLLRWGEQQKITPFVQFDKGWRTSSYDWFPTFSIEELRPTRYLTTHSHLSFLYTNAFCDIIVCNLHQKYQLCSAILETSKCAAKTSVAKCLIQIWSKLRDSLISVVISS